jgi:hypothetical protein
MCELYGENYPKFHDGEIRSLIFPSAEDEMIPEWFNHQSRGGTFTFWFRNKLPSITFLYSSPSYGPDFDASSSELSIYINGFREDRDLALAMTPSHTYLFNPEFHETYFSSEPELMPKLVEAFEKILVPANNNICILSL